MRKLIRHTVAGKVRADSPELLKLHISAEIEKGGSNKEDAKRMTEEHFDYAVRVYPESTVREWANIIRTIY